MSLYLRVKIGRLLFMVVCLFATHLPVAQATSCDVFVRRKSPSSSRLQALGYRVQVSSWLDSSLVSLRTHTDQGLALITEGQQSRLYFEFPDGEGNRPILSLSFDADRVPSCQDLRSRFENLSHRRQALLPAIRYLKNVSQASFIDALLAVESLAFAKAGHGPERPVDVGWLKQVEQSAMDEGAFTSTGDFFVSLDRARRSLIRSALSQYCRARTTLTELSSSRCTNCIGQAALLLATYVDGHLQPPVPWQLGFAVYADHVQAVLYHSLDGTAIDLLTHHSSKLPHGVAVLPPSEMIRLGLRANSDLVWPTDGINLGATEYLLNPKPWWGFGTENLVKIPTPDAGDAGRVDALSFTGLPSGVVFNSEPTPERADLSILANKNSDPQFIKSEGLRSFEMRVRSELRVRFRFLDDEKLLVLESPDRELLARLKGMSLENRYKELERLSLALWREQYLPALETLRLWLGSGNPLRPPPGLAEALPRLKVAASNFGLRQGPETPKGLTLLHLMAQSGAEPALQLLKSSLKSFFARVGRDHRALVREAEAMSDDEIQNVIEIYDELEHSELGNLFSPYADYFGSRRNWEELTRPLILGLLYDPDFIYTAPMSPSEISARKKFEANLKLVEPAKIELVGPKVELPSVNIHCGDDDRGWTLFGAFALHCPEKAARNFQVQIEGNLATARLREIHEMRADFLGGLVALNLEAFFHSGNFLLLQESMNERLQSSIEQTLVQFMTSPDQDYEYNSMRMSQASALRHFGVILLSERIPEDSVGRDFLRGTAVRRSAPAWIMENPAYLAAFADYKAGYKKTLDARNFQFAADPLNYDSFGRDRDWTSNTKFGNPTIVITEYRDGGRVAPVATTLSLRSTIGAFKMSLVMSEEDGRIEVHPQGDTGQGRICHEALPIPLGQGQVFSDQLDLACP